MARGFSEKCWEGGPLGAGQGPGESDCGRRRPGATMMATLPRRRAMSEATTSQPPPGPDAALAEQRERWARGDRVAVEALLENHPGVGSDTEALLDLIYNEHLLREQAGETPPLGDYA